MNVALFQCQLKECIGDETKKKLSTLFSSRVDLFKYAGKIL